MENKLEKRMDLLDGQGRIVKPGYATKMLYNYNKENIKAHPFALKEWDFYQIYIGDYVLKMTIGNISYIANFSAAVRRLLRAATLDSILVGDLVIYNVLRKICFSGTEKPIN